MEISANVENGFLIVEKTAKNHEKECWSKDLTEFKTGKYDEPDFFVGRRNRHKLFLWYPVKGNILMVYSNAKAVKCAYMNPVNAHWSLVRLINELLSFRLTRRGLDICWFGGIVNRMGVKISDARIKVGRRASRPFDIPVSEKGFRKKADNPAYIRKFHFDLNELVNQGGSVNSQISVALKINDFPVEFLLKNRMFDENDKYRHIPLYSLYYKKYALQLKFTRLGILLFLCRPMQVIEFDRHFRFWESRFVSGMLYKAGSLVKKYSSRKIALFYEKYCEKAEEGCYDIFLEMQKCHPKNAYYIIDRNMPDYECIKDHPNVVKKYSAHYYWLLFRATSYITTETPFHLTVLNSNNRYFRKTVADNDFFFLQHGITYMKCQGKYSPFIKGREACPSYVIVCSEKEKNVVSKMFRMDPDHVLNLGMAIFSKIEYKHLSQTSDDIAVIMLTWKPYEEYMDDFTKSTYYQTTLRIYNMMLTYLPQEKIKIVIHPRTGALLDGTELSPYIWRRSMPEVLRQAKLLITDYSSVCYNTFYQGGGVVFFQEDLQYYERQNGKLIPAEDEYIGKRAFSAEELDRMLDRGIKDGKILLDQFRDEEFERRYEMINEFSDGRNIERICQVLQEKDLI